MSSLTRRDLLGQALLAGAGATVVGSLAPRALAAGLNPPELDPAFLGGQIIKAQSSGALTVLDHEDRPRPARLTGGSRSIWKSGAFGAASLDTGDCIYATGELESDGVFNIDRVWVAIDSFAATVVDATSSGLTLDARGQTREAHLSAITEIQDGGGRFVRGGTSKLKAGDFAHVVGYHDRSSGEFVASRVWQAFDGVTASGEIGPVQGRARTVDAPDGPLVTCPYTWKGLATFFCCGNVSGCGYSCGSSGNGWCTTQSCHSYNHQMAWKYVYEGTRTCNASCGNCCDNTLDIVQCGEVGHLLRSRAPFQSMSV